MNILVIQLIDDRSDIHNRSHCIRALIIKSLLNIGRISPASHAIKM